MSDHTQTPNAGVDYMKDTAEIIRYLRQTAEADDKLLELAEEAVLFTELRTLEQQEQYQEFLRDIHACQRVIQSTIDRLLDLAARCEQVPEDLQHRLVEMERNMRDSQKMARAVQKAHDKAGANLLAIKESLERIRMEQAEDMRNERDNRGEPCLLRIAKSFSGYYWRRYTLTYTTAISHTATMPGPFDSPASSKNSAVAKRGDADSVAGHCKRSPSFHSSPPNSRYARDTLPEVLTGMGKSQAEHTSAINTAQALLDEMRHECDKVSARLHSQQQALLRELATPITEPLGLKLPTNVPHDLPIPKCEPPPSTAGEHDEDNPDLLGGCTQPQPAWSALIDASEEVARAKHNLPQGVRLLNVAMAQVTRACAGLAQHEAELVREQGELARVRGELARARGELALCQQEISRLKEGVAKLSAKLEGVGGLGKAARPNPVQAVETEYKVTHGIRPAEDWDVVALGDMLEAMGALESMFRQINKSIERTHDMFREVLVAVVPGYGAMLEHKAAAQTASDGAAEEDNVVL
ncbi:hypothetical protein B0I37DRAFT_437382 [Chaetomium sp. MPI-CAGE-AT-0009]|nr:hypothetical protein B0I37DRAFT_437382 [Chaetomium sp. MPI-CAGE-AT-0009]